MASQVSYTASVGEGRAEFLRKRRRWWWCSVVVVVVVVVVMVVDFLGDGSSLVVGPFWVLLEVGILGGFFGDLPGGGSFVVFSGSFVVFFGSS